VVVSGPSKAPLALTNLRGETLADTNRGRVRGWVALAIGALVVFALLAWPDYVVVLILTLIAAVLAAFFAKVTLATFSDAEREPPEDSETIRDPVTGERD
jgi:asparagine N-glycosylation enzyme membrane subunit Stt3